MFGRWARTGRLNVVIACRLRGMETKACAGIRSIRSDLRNSAQVCSVWQAGCTDLREGEDGPSPARCKLVQKGKRVHGSA